MNFKSFKNIVTQSTASDVSEQKKRFNLLVKKLKPQNHDNITEKQMQFVLEGGSFFTAIKNFAIDTLDKFRGTKPEKLNEFSKFSKLNEFFKELNEKTFDKNVDEKLKIANEFLKMVKAFCAKEKYFDDGKYFTFPGKISYYVTNENINKVWETLPEKKCEKNNIQVNRVYSVYVDYEGHEEYFKGYCLVPESKVSNFIVYAYLISNKLFEYSNPEALLDEISLPDSGNNAVIVDVPKDKDEQVAIDDVKNDLCNYHKYKNYAIFPFSPKLFDDPESDKYRFYVYSGKLHPNNKSFEPIFSKLIQDMDKEKKEKKKLDEKKKEKKKFGVVKPHLDAQNKIFEEAKTQLKRLIQKEQHKFTFLKACQLQKALDLKTRYVLSSDEIKLFLSFYFQLFASEHDIIKAVNKIEFVDEIDLKLKDENKHKIILEHAKYTIQEGMDLATHFKNIQDYFDSYSNEKKKGIRKKDLQYNKKDIKFVQQLFTNYHRRCARYQKKQETCLVRRDSYFSITNGTLFDVLFSNTFQTPSHFDYSYYTTPTVYSENEQLSITKEKALDCNERYYLLYAIIPSVILQTSKNPFANIVLNTLAEGEEFLNYTHFFIENELLPAYGENLFHEELTGGGGKRKRGDIESTVTISKEKKEKGPNEKRNRIDKYAVSQNKMMVRKACMKIIYLYQEKNWFESLKIDFTLNDILDNCFGNKIDIFAYDYKKDKENSEKFTETEHFKAYNKESLQKILLFSDLLPFFSSETKPYFSSYEKEQAKNVKFTVEQRMDAKAETYLCFKVEQSNKPTIVYTENKVFFFLLRLLFKFIEGLKREGKGLNGGTKYFYNKMVKSKNIPFRRICAGFVLLGLNNDKRFQFAKFIMQVLHKLESKKTNKGA